MAFIRCGSSGSGSLPVNFTKTLIMDNSSADTTLNFTEDYRNYAVLEFVTQNGSTLTRFITTSSIVDAIFQYCPVFCLNEYNTNQYVTYSQQSYTLWTKHNSRNVNCVAIYGMTADKIINIDTLYSRQAYGSSNVTFTTTKNLFNYDMMIVATCTSSYDETQPCAYLVYPTLLEPTLTDRILWLGNKYNSGSRIFIYEHTVDAYQYFMFQGIKFT